jgi:outer membrane lipoprotein-sorting protein
MVLRSLVLGAVLVTATGSAQPSGEEILTRVETSLSGVRDYTVSLEVTADVERLKVPPMHVTMYFKQPDKVHFDSEGFALLPREGIAFSVGRLRKRYSVEAVDEEVVDGEKLLRLTLMPRADQSAVRRLFMYVNPSRWTPERLASTLVDGRDMLATLTYQQFEGHWLPSKLVMKMTSSAKDSTEISPLDQSVPIPRPSIPRSGTITIEYSGYRINTGLPDELFMQKEKSGKE